MKTVILSAKFVVCILAFILIPNSLFANSLSHDMHDSILNLLGNKVRVTEPGESQSVYFAQGKNKIQIDIEKEQITLAVNNRVLQLDRSENNRIEFLQNDSNQVYFRVTTYIENQNGNDVFSTWLVRLARLDSENLLASVTEKVYLKYELASNRYVRLSVPQISKEDVIAPYITSLTSTEISKLAVQTAGVIGDKRNVAPIACVLSSATTMNCDWSLETDYTPDTLHGIFSVIDGKVSELLDFDLEPGC